MESSKEHSKGKGGGNGKGDRYGTGDRIGSGSGHGNGNGYGIGNGENNNQRWRRLWPWITAGVILLMLLVVRLSLRSSIVLDAVKHQIESAAAGQLNGQLRIGTLSGDLWSHLRFTGIRIELHENGDVLQVMQADTLYIRYSPLALIRKTARIDELRISHPVVRLEQDEDETWNVTRLLPVTGKPDDEEPAGALPVRIELNRFDLVNGEIHVRSASLLPDTTLRIDQLGIHADGMVDGETFSARLHSLNLQLHEGRLDEPVRFETGFTADENTLTLEKLVFATGRSLIEGRGRAGTDGEDIDFEVGSEPVSWKDIRAYANDAPIAGDIRMGIEVSGSLKQLMVGLNASADGLSRFSLQTDLSLDGDPALTGFILQIDSFNGPLISGNPEFPSFSELSLHGGGLVVLTSHEDARMQLNGHLTGLKADHLLIDRITVGGTLEDQQLKTGFVILADGGQGPQEVRIDANVSQLFSDLPAWKTDLRFSGIDPAWWTSNPELEGKLTGTLEIEGAGFGPGDQPWTYALAIRDARIAGYEIDDLQVNGYLDRSTTTAALGMQMAGGHIRLDGDYEWPSDNPAYRMNLDVANLDLAGLPGFEELDSNLNLHFKGNGKGLDPATLTLDAEAGMRPSMISGIRIEQLSAPLSIAGGMVTIERAGLVSDLADGSLNVRQSLLDIAHPGNEIGFDLQLKDAGLLARFADVEIINARGGLSGTFRTVDGLPRIDTRLDLTELQIDTLSAKVVSGTFSAVITDSIPFSADVLIEQPGAGKLSLQNISLRTDGLASGDITLGDYHIELLTGDGSGLVTRAEYRVAPDSMVINTSELTLSDPDRRLDLEEPFRFRYIGGLAGMDTLRMVSTDGAMLHLHFAQYAEDEYSGMFRGRNVNLGNLQSSILGEAVFSGIYNGNLEADLRNDRLYVHVDALINDFRFNGLELDSIDVELDIDRERLTAMLRITDPAGELLTGQLNAPFIAADPETLDDAFFLEPVSGELRFNESSFSRFTGLLEYYGFTGLDGRIGMQASLSGKAGEPVFGGFGYLSRARISNVEVDSSLIRWEYNHEKGHLAFDGFVESLGQRAAGLDGTIPFLLDMRKFELVEPGEEEEVAIRLNTDGFNIAAFNEFLDPAVIRNLRGRLYSDFSVAGTVQEHNPGQYPDRYPLQARADNH
jgi:hypothetical protein